MGREPAASSHKAAGTTRDNSSAKPAQPAHLTLLPQLSPSEEILNAVIYGGRGSIAVCGGEVCWAEISHLLILISSTPHPHLRIPGQRPLHPAPATYAHVVALYLTQCSRADVRRTQRCMWWILSTELR